MPIATTLPKPNHDALIADIWLDALCAIQRRGTAGTIRQALDDIEDAFAKADAAEAEQPRTLELTGAATP